MNSWPLTSGRSAGLLNTDFSYKFIGLIMQKSIEHNMLPCHYYSIFDMKAEHHVYAAIL